MLYDLTLWFFHVVSLLVLHWHWISKVLRAEVFSPLIKQISPFQQKQRDRRGSRKVKNVWHIFGKYNKDDEQQCEIFSFAFKSPATVFSPDILWKNIHWSSPIASPKQCFNSKKIFVSHFAMEQKTLKNVYNCLNMNIYSYLETSGCQSSYLYLNVVHFFNTSVN
jgi:hypothetical protein